VQWGSVARKDLVLTKREPRKVAYANRLRSFAACCGTHLFFEDSKESHTIDVTIASLMMRRRLRRKKRSSSKINCHGL
jgi:hypothetical protein